jgi:large subunit ribosomal protein L13
LKHDILQLQGLRLQARRYGVRGPLQPAASSFALPVGGIEVKTYYAKPNEVEREWVLIDAEDQVLGRVATLAANILRGKNKPQYTPHVDTGDFVVIINADKVRVTGNKGTDKHYYHYSGYPGGLKDETFNEAMAKHPERVLEHAIKGMIPKTTLGRAQAKKLKVYAGPEHPHAAQNPRKIEVEG